MNASRVLFRVSGVTGVGTAGTLGPQKRLCFVLGTIRRCDVIPGGRTGPRRRWLSGYCICQSIKDIGINTVMKTGVCRNLCRR